MKAAKENEKASQTGKMLWDILFYVITVEALDTWLVKNNLLKDDSCCNHGREKNKAIVSTETENKIVISVVSTAFLMLPAHQNPFLLFFFF